MERKESDLVWKIAGGIILAVIVLTGLERCQQRIAVDQAMEEYRKATSDPDPFGWQKQAAERSAAEQARQRTAAAHEREANTLKPGQRCIQGQRFQRVENGWEQLPHQPC